MRRHGFYSGGSTLGYTPPVAVDPITVSSVWTGNVSTTGATVRIRSTDATAATLRYSTASNLAGYSTAAGSESTDDVWTFTLSGLSANTRYYYGFAGSDVTATFRTFPASGSFGIAAASCGGHSGGEYVTDDVSNAPTYQRIADRMDSDNILGFMHLGDRHYRDISSDNDSLFQDAYHDVMAASNQLAMHKAGWVDYVWDDHDYGPNDSGASSASKPAAQTVYRQHVPHWTLPVADSIEHTYVIGRVRFIHLDVRSYRSANGATDNSSKTMLGATQKAWLLDVVDNATEPLIVIDTVCGWNGSASTSWGVFSTERDELISEFTTMSKLDRLFMIHGDNHFQAYDDGTNAPGGIPTANLGPLDAGFTSNDGTWSSGIFKNEQQQYGVIQFADNGSQIVPTIKGYSVANPSGTETERFSITGPTYVG